ncbi:unnamed protein product [Didymodactylos carnosus]|uniref:Claudin n=1 Tax=Didymodactylos carnosus TaxID=1234261 RepID=A0A815PRN8_9BILA|nr:unnamed protein product [Didymodactylos carnosus]CAF1611259.1 unnamed protein product [Didymodactylos carnosus]CAF4325894.1 unnamed protein product [Didymodactylos carnosus]CAF4424976.1 unnamed protein product [Didymodactylos carnosus]
MQNKSLLTYLACAILLAACAFFIASNASPTWGTLTINAVKTSSGLWQSCMGGRCDAIPNSCSKLVGMAKSSCDKVLATRAFITMACITSAIGFICLLALAAFIKNSQTLCYVCVALAVLSFIFGLIGFSLGVDRYVTKPFKIGAAAICGLIGWILSLASAVCSILIIKSTQPA